MKLENGISLYYINSNFLDLEYKTIYTKYPTVDFIGGANSATKLAFIGWNMMLEDKCQIDFKDLGFENYYKLNY